MSSHKSEPSKRQTCPCTLHTVPINTIVISIICAQFSCNIMCLCTLTLLTRDVSYTTGENLIMNNHMHTILPANLARPRTYVLLVHSQLFGP